MSDMMVHIECRSQEVLIRVPYAVAKKFCEVDEEFKEKFHIANRRHLDPEKENG
jgi:hypothetical protein